MGFLIYSLQGGGAERMVSKLANFMVDKVDEVTLFLINGEGIAYSLNPKVKQVVFDFQESGNRIKKIIKRLQVIRKQIKEANIDVLYAFTATMYPYAALCCKGLKTKVIGAERANPKVYGSMMWKVLSFMSTWCDGFVFQTEGARDYYPTKIGKKSIVIPNAVPAEIFDTNVKIDKRRALRFCTSGRLHTDKDYDTLLQAFAMYLQKAEGTLTIFGDGVLREKYEKMCKELGIAEYVIFAGFVSNVYERMAEYDAFVFSSKAEGMPNAILEAMATGLPCISSDCDFGPREFIRDGENGFLCEVGNSQDMADKLLWLYNNPDKIEAMSDCAKQVREKYSQDKILGQYLEYAQKIGR